MRSCAAGLLTLIVVASCARPEPIIRRESVARVLAVLSADSMRGRAAFTPDAERAADFIAKEFAAIGLASPPGAVGYRQTFPVFAVETDSTNVVLNGSRMPASRTAARLTRSVHWTDPTDVEIVVLGPGGDPQAQLMQLFRGEGNRIALIHSSHEPLFVRLQRWFGRVTRTLDTTSGVNLVLVLTDDDVVRSIEVQATTTIDTTARLANVIGTIAGRRPDELIVFSGHYDHVGVRAPVDGDSIANGANDNATGTTAVIELARYHHALGHPERTLVFVAFAAEEAGGYGSEYLAARLNPDEIVALFNIEMIGKVAADGPNRAWITGWDESDFGSLLAAAVPDSVFAFTADPYPDENLFYRSDNAVFARLGVPAHSISTTPIDVDPDYHRVTDEVETLDIDNVTATIRAIALAARPIVAGTVTPSRVDPDRLQ
jgi:hypothetical protein